MKTSFGSLALLGPACLLAASLLTPNLLRAEEPAFEWPRSSPRAEVSQRVATTDIEISYSRPSARGRTIFGGLVPFGDVWRTGADSATRIEFSTDVAVNGESLPAGSYELFTIPGQEEWVVIFQQHTSQWGSYAYDASKDVVRFAVQPVRLPQPVETLTLSIDALTSRSAVLNIAWETVRVPVDITIDVRETVLPHFEKALQAEGERPYYRAAMFYFENDLGIDRAAELMAQAVEARPDSFPLLYRHALILEAKGDIAGAVAAAEKSKELTAKVEGAELREEYLRLNDALLSRLRNR